MQSVRQTTQSAKETFALGASLGERLVAGDVVLLEGPLGAGKTHFTQGIARGLGILEPVTSPTFTLIAEYDGRVPLTHMDLYRLYDDPHDAMTMANDSLTQIAFEDYLDGWSVVVIEWASGALSMLDSYLRVVIDYHQGEEESPSGDVSATTRSVTISAHGKTAETRLQEWMNTWQS